MRTIITEAQRQARAANARLSRGPVTEAGKAASSMNATKFGFCAKDPVLPGESQEEFAEFRDGLLRSYAPVGDDETSLVLQIIDASWRLRRFGSAEAAIFTVGLYEEQADLARKEARQTLRPAPQPEPDDVRSTAPYLELMEREAELRAEANRPEYALGRIFMRDARGAGAFSRLSRYEASIDRLRFRCARDLLQLQLARRQKGKLRNDLTDAASPSERAA